MEFPDINTESGLKFLDNYLQQRSYISDYEPSQNDVIVFRAFRKEPGDQFENAQRWHRHIKSFGSARIDFPEASESVSVAKPQGCDEVQKKAVCVI